MGSMHGTAFLMISNSMGKHGEHGNPFFHEFRWDKKCMEAWNPCAAFFV